VTKATAVAAPKPWAPPVTNATFESNEPHSAACKQSCFDKDIRYIC